MTDRKRAVIERALVRKGFVARAGKDHRFYFFRNENGEEIVRTKMSHGTSSRDIGDPLIGKMSKQCHLTKREFLELVDCTLSQEEYHELLVTRGGGRE